MLSEELEDTPTIICNKAKCILCEEIIISHHRHDHKACKCLGLYVDGGNDYLKRSFGSKGCYEELSVMSDSPFELIRENCYRGSRGKCSTLPLKWLKLSEISNDYLNNLIVYCEDNKQYNSIWYQQYVKESEYRTENNIEIGA